MELGRLRTLRGQITAAAGTGKVNLVVADGLINYGLRILRFRMWPVLAPQGLNTVSYTGILSLDPILAGESMNAATNRQIAWTYGSALGAPTPVNIQHDREIIDPDHIVNRDMYLTLDNTTQGVYNYLIEAQVVSLTDDEAIITIIKETSQA